MKEGKTVSGAERIQNFYIYNPVPVKDSSIVDAKTSMSAITYLIIHAQYFALMNLNLKLQYCARASFSLLLILLYTCSHHNRFLCQVECSPGDRACVASLCPGGMMYSVEDTGCVRLPGEERISMSSHVVRSVFDFNKMVQAEVKPINHICTNIVTMLLEFNHSGFLGGLLKSSRSA